jgi:hypothetical protein
MADDEKLREITGEELLTAFANSIWGTAFPLDGAAERQLTYHAELLRRLTPPTDERADAHRALEAWIEHLSWQPDECSCHADYCAYHTWGLELTALQHAARQAAEIAGAAIAAARKQNE